MQEITPTELSTLEQAVIIDVREADEVAVMSVPGALHLPMSSFLDHLEDVPREETVYVLCHSGGRSARVTGYLEQQGYDAVNVTGGILAWSASGLPVQRATDAG
ncbi:rhodanese-like domain-containing protein [Plantibacter flavus]|uniref:rhodanese-like domain-containing protein n=1 Tax=Plantibacter flavus TaxID=150123 RepID=UPI003F14590B